MTQDTLLIILIVFLPVIASIYIRVAYNNNLKKNSSKKLTGYDVARKILDAHGLKDMIILETRGTLTDHYDPNRKVIKLSKEIYNGTSIASNAVAAHEVGHAIQDKEGYIYLKIRSLIFPVVNILSNISYYVILIGFVLEFLELVWLGILFVGTGVLFQIITLPVEFNASKRALIELEKLELINNEDKKGIKNMLTAAALTYVAGVLAGIIQLLRLIGMTKEN